MTARSTPLRSSSTSRAGSRTGGSVAGASSPPRRNGTPMTDATPPAARAAAYVRESTEEQGQGFSPDAQRQAVVKFAAENDLTIVGEYCDFHSGWRKADGRPEFQRLMADAAERRFDVVLVFHTSRFARNQVEARRYKALLRERLGIRVVSVTQPMGDDPSDPSLFLAESIHEMFDEYYSVSLSFWTRAGLAEKARQGHLVGQLPWGYVRDPDTSEAVPDPDRAPLVLGMFERYATGHESDRAIAAWLNAKGARTARGRAFGKDTVREMLVNASYCGYVTGLRDQSREIRGRHEPIVLEALFDRVQEVRSWRTRVLKPGPPSDEYLLRKLLYCERCGARMHGTRGSRPPVRRYVCSTRRYGDPCGEPIVKAEPLEAQLVDWLRTFQPDDELRERVLAAIREATRRGRGWSSPPRPRRPARTPPRPLRHGRHHQAAVRPAPPSAGARAGATRAANRPAARRGRRAPGRLRPLLGDRAIARRATQAHRLALRAHLGARRRDRRRQTARRLRAVLRGRPQTTTAPHEQVRCRRRERRDSNPRPPA